MSNASYYVYGIARTKDGFAAAGQGIMRGDLDTITVGDLTIIVSDAPEGEIMSTRRNMLAHTKVLEDAMSMGPVLPFRFGMVVPNDRVSASLVKGREAELLGRLEALAGRTEVGIRINLDEAEVMKMIVDSHNDLKSAYESLAGRDEKQTHYQRLELGRAVAGHLEETRDDIGRRALTALSEVTAEFKELDRTGDREALHLACLVSADEEARILEVLEGIDAEHPGLYQIKYVSPVPPYNFISFDLSTDEEMAA
ncbi:MAG: GvpL/GvpF family gas vesicle protein [Parvularculaceae bacterium]|nr:GvpL/GvpF family gas vesicle protein [Parvularculaceae bacterium]